MESNSRIFRLDPNLDKLQADDTFYVSSYVRCNVSIQTFGNKETERFFLSGKTRAPWQQVKDVAARKLDQLDAAADIGDVRSPPGNRLEQLSGRLKGFWSIRINDQWRIVFRWQDAGPKDVVIVDYH